MRYEVIRRDSADELTEAVNSYLNVGWELVGGISVVVAYSHYKDRDDCLMSSDTTIWAQAMKRSAVQHRADHGPR